MSASDTPACDCDGGHAESGYAHREGCAQERDCATALTESFHVGISDDPWARDHFDDPESVPVPVTDSPDLATMDHPNVAACVIGGVKHDYRPYTYWLVDSLPRTSWRCVWCHAVACGDYDEPDPCMEPYHHRSEHRSRSGERWPLGEMRQEARRG